LGEEFQSEWAIGRLSAGKSERARVINIRRLRLSNRLCEGGAGKVWAITSDFPSYNRLSESLECALEAVLLGRVRQMKRSKQQRLDPIFGKLADLQTSALSSKREW